MVYTIGELASRSGLKSNTIRFYERMGLIEPEGRSDVGYRLYGLESIDIINFIQNAKALNFTLKEINTLLNLRISELGTSKDMLVHTKLKITEVENTLSELKHIHQCLNILANKCPGDNTPIIDCPIVGYLHQKGNTIWNIT